MLGQWTASKCIVAIVPTCSSIPAISRLGKLLERWYFLSISTTTLSMLCWVESSVLEIATDTTASVTSVFTSLSATSTTGSFNM